VDLPEELKYTAKHEWIRMDGNVATVGITDFAQGELGDIVFLEMPGVGDQVQAGAECGTIEAVKTVAELFAPLSGKIKEINTALEKDASLINQDPYGEGWMMRIELSNTGELDSLLTADAYRAQVN
jgi:glycine cleavage system H protein